MTDMSTDTQGEDQGVGASPAGRAAGPSDPSRFPSRSADSIPDAVLPGDVVQITDEAHHWHPCFVTASELKAWGIQGYVLIPHNDGTPPGHAYIRIQNGQFERIGTAVFMTQDDADERDLAQQARGQ